MSSASDWRGFGPSHGGGGATPPDVRIVTSGGRCIPGHSTVLASASPVLERKLDRPRKHPCSERVILILGVPCEAATAFIRLLYSSSKSTLSSEEAGETMEKYGVHLLVLSHAYRVGWLKRACEEGLAARLATETVVDVLQLARQCDAPLLYQKCMWLIAKDFDAVQRSEAWMFLESHDAGLELEILQFLQEADQRKKRWRRGRAEQEIYEQLNEAMECLVHICTEGCTEVGPHDGEPPSKRKGPCTHFRTCEGVQLLIRHFAECRRKLSARVGCPHCKRMWQLLRLHASMCDQPEGSCRVPLCRQLKSRMEVEENGDDETWKLLVKKMIIAKVMFSLDGRKRMEQVNRITARYIYKPTRQFSVA